MYAGCRRHAAAAEATCKALALDGLIVIGGDDSNTNTAVLAEYFLQRGALRCCAALPALSGLPCLKPAARCSKLGVQLELCLLTVQAECPAAWCKLYCGTAPYCIAPGCSLPS